MKIVFVCLVQSYIFLTIISKITIWTKLNILVILLLYFKKFFYKVDKYSLQNINQMWFSTIKCLINNTNNSNKCNSNILGTGIKRKHIVKQRYFSLYSESKINKYLNVTFLKYILNLKFWKFTPSFWMISRSITYPRYFLHFLNFNFIFILWLICIK